MIKKLIPVVMLGAALDPLAELWVFVFLHVENLTGTLDIEVIGGTTLFLPDGTCTQNIDVRPAGDRSPLSRRQTRAKVLPDSICAGIRAFSIATASAEFADGVK